MPEEKHSANDISQIRELIFGDKIREYDRRFTKIDETLNKIQENLIEKEKQLAALQQDLQGTANNLAEQVQNDLEKMQKDWEETRQEIMRKIEELINDKADRLQMGNYLIEMGMRLKGENVMEQIMEHGSKNANK